MPLWVVLVTLGVVKLVVASLMLWLPFRYDSAMMAVDDEPGQTTKAAARCRRRGRWIRTRDSRSLATRGAVRTGRPLRGHRRACVATLDG